MKDNGRKSEPEAANSRSRWQKYRLNSALVRAIDSDDVAELKSLIARGANVNFRNKEGETPLSSAAAWNRTAAARILLAHGANPNAVDSGGGTVLMWAAQHAEPELIRALLAKGANPAMKNASDQTALMHCDWRGAEDPHAEEIRQMILAALGNSRELVGK